MWANIGWVVIGLIVASTLLPAAGALLGYGRES